MSIPLSVGLTALAIAQIGVLWRNAPSLSSSCRNQAHATCDCRAKSMRWTFFVFSGQIERCGNTSCSVPVVVENSRKGLRFGTWT